MAEPTPLLQDTRWLVTTGIAVWGAILSSWKLGMDLWSNYSRIKVSFQLGEMSETPIHILGEPSRRVVSISANAVNRGRTDVKFERDCCEIEVKKHEKTRIAVHPDVSEPGLPATISGGHNLRMDIRAHHLFPIIKKMTGGPARFRIYVKDAVGRQYRSGWVSLP